jgi:type IV pilus assembly protein PilM
VVGLDIGSFALKLVELQQHKSGEFALQCLGIEPLSPEAIVDGSIMDSSLVVEAIEKLSLETRVKNPQFATSLSATPSSSRDRASDDVSGELSASISGPSSIPFDINDVRMDYVLLSDPGRAATRWKSSWSHQRDKVNDCLGDQPGRSHPGAGRRRRVRDPERLRLNYDVDRSKIIALVNMGAAVTSINVLARGQTLFWRDISFGGNQFTEALQREFNLSFENAEALKRPRGRGATPRATPGACSKRWAARMAGEIRKNVRLLLDHRQRRIGRSGRALRRRPLTAGLRDVLAEQPAARSS